MSASIMLSRRIDRCRFPILHLFRNNGVFGTLPGRERLSSVKGSDIGKKGGASSKSRPSRRWCAVEILNEGDAI